MTLLFAGHDTTTSTVAFLFHELARNPDVAADPTFDLDLAIDETLRLYPPAWIGPRRSIEPFRFAGHDVPGGVPVNYCSWASHRLPDVWEDPTAFRPERFAPGQPRADPQGRLRPVRRRLAHVHRHALRPGRGRRDRAAIRERFRLELQPGYELPVRQMPTISPKRGLPVIARTPNA